MFGKNPKPSFRYEDTGERLLVHSLFPTIQGEGPFTGHPAIFIRLGGCPLHCWFCDTDFAEEGSSWYPVEELAWMCVSNWDNARWRAAPLVVITGGEPLYQNLDPLIRTLLDSGFRVQVETSGATKHAPALLWQSDVTAVVSPKTGRVHRDVLRHATDWKYIIGHDTITTEEGVPVSDTQGTGNQLPLASPFGRNSPTPYRVWLQPREDYMPDGRPNTLANERNLQRTKELAMQFGFCVSLQTHKILGVE
jgi:organic radical activating enzyme